MKELSGKVAFITGAASGIGLALSKASGAAGMKIMMADIDEAGLDRAVAELLAEDVDACAVYCDVSSEESMRVAADATLAAFGKVHLLVNNAGVLAKGGIGDLSLERWQWALDVNVMGVVRGVEIFLPLLQGHDEGSHILNTASVAGCVGLASMAAYCTTKHALVGYSEALYYQLLEEGIGVSVLCPGFVATDIAQTARYGADEFDSDLQAAVSAGMSPAVVAQHAVDQLRKGAFFIFTHPGTRGEVLERFDSLAGAFDATDASEVIHGDPDSQRVADRETTENLHS